jgi:hypothetical protein
MNLHMCFTFSGFLVSVDSYMNLQVLTWFFGSLGCLTMSPVIYLSFESSEV